MTPAPSFTVRVDQNRYLPPDGREVHAIVTVESAGGPVGVSDSGVVIIVDTSGSMTGERIKEAKRAAEAAVDSLRDGVSFAIVAGTTKANLIFPDSGMAVAKDSSRHRAKAAIAKLTASGGTAMGAWLRQAGTLLREHQGLRQAILLTDGKNGESERTLTKALVECEGVFVCDCRGVGTDWKVDELRRISSSLLGSLDIVASPEDLAADFRSMVQAAMGKTHADVALRVWTPANSTLRYLRQVLPSVEDLTRRRADRNAREGDYPLGSWGVESRDYHLCVEVPPGEVGREIRAAWVKLVIGDEVVASGNILAEWTPDESLSTRINPQVAHYTGQAELASAIQDGLQARKDGDLDTATARFGRAVQLATASGNQAASDLLGRVVDIEDPVTGTVRLKREVAKADEMSLDTRSTRTVRTRKSEG